MRVMGRIAMAARTLVVLVSLSLAGAAAALAGPVTSAPDPVHGKQLAQRLCSNCHLVDSSQTKAMADVPSFKEIANRQNQTAGAIMGMIIIPKHPMPVIPISKSELKDISAYIMSLRETQ